MKHKSDKFLFIFVFVEFILSVLAKFIFAEETNTEKNTFLYPIISKMAEQMS